MSELAGTVAIVGFPNVGKSTLVNRLSGTRAAVVHETPGVTRDRKELVCEWGGKRFLLIDTGGVDVAGADPIARSIVEQVRAALVEADLVLFLVDAQAGVTPGDEEIAEILRHSHKPVLCAPIHSVLEWPALESDDGQLAQRLFDVGDVGWRNASLQRFRKSLVRSPCSDVHRYFSFAFFRIVRRLFRCTAGLLLAFGRYASTRSATASRRFRFTGSKRSDQPQVRQRSRSQSSPHIGQFMPSTVRKSGASAPCHG